MCDDMPVVPSGTGIYFAVPTESVRVASPAKPNVVSFGAYEFNPYSRGIAEGRNACPPGGSAAGHPGDAAGPAGELVTREELQKKLWPGDTFVDFEHSLNAAVKRLRATLNDSADQPRYIETLARRGYRFVAPVNMARRQIGIAKQSAVTPALVRASAPSQFPCRTIVAHCGAAVCCQSPLLLWGWRRVAESAATPAVPTVRSLAVLPLENLSGDPSQEYFADGMTEELIGRLSMIHGLRVISRTSAMHFKNTQLSVPEIAKTLGVDAIVEGSVMREGSRVRVHAQLIRGATDEHLWSETYDREQRDSLALQSEVAQSIARKVEATVTGEERARLVAARQVSPEVYESYLKGVFALDRATAGLASRRVLVISRTRSRETPALHRLTSAWRQRTTTLAQFSPALHPMTCVEK